MDATLSSIIYAVTFLFSLCLIGFLYWLAYRYPGARRLWGWLAVGWSVNTFASLAWGVVETFAASAYPAWIDNLYVARYAFVLLALWLYPTPWPGRRLPRLFAGLLGAVLLAGLVLWLGFVQPLSRISTQPLSYILAGTIFPLLDAGLLYAAWRRWRDEAGSPLRPLFTLLLLSTLAYGIANWANFRLRAVTPDGDSAIALLGWFLTDVFVAAAGVWFVRNARLHGTLY